MSAKYCREAPGHEFHGPYHDREYGFPAREDAVLLERLVLEINQAGLSWLTVLKKRAAFQRAFRGFDVDKVAAFGPGDVKRLLADAAIIRNRLKVDAAIDNARRIRAIRESHGSFAAWLDAHHPRSKNAWVDLFKETFRFTGGDRGRVPDEPGLSARRACAELPRPSPHRAQGALAGQTPAAG